MATNGLEFGAQVDAWVAATQGRMTAVFRESTKRTVSLAQNGPPGIPVDTGNARASVRASLQSMPQIDPNLKGNGKPVAYDPGEVLSVIANAQIGDIIYVGWTAAYVGFLEAGHSKKAPSGFVRLAALQWQNVVSQVVSDVKGGRAA